MQMVSISMRKTIKYSRPFKRYDRILIFTILCSIMPLELGKSFCSGSPIEKVFKDRQIEKLNIQFCKFILGVNKKASNLVVRGELKDIYLILMSLSTMLKYWLHLHTIDPSQDRLLIQAMKENYLMFNNNQSCWLQCIYLILTELNLVNIFHNPFSLKNKTLLDIKKKLKHRIERQWLADINDNKGKSSDMNSGNKLRTYATFKCQCFLVNLTLMSLKFKKDKRYLSFALVHIN